jgi:Ca-activated chloride channel family protein
MLKRTLPILTGVLTLAVAVIGLICLFGDDIRRQFGMSADALAGQDHIALRNMTGAGSDANLTKKTMKNFGISTYAEPSSGGNTYAYVAPNTVTDTRRDALSTFAVDVDTSSYAQGRRTINEGRLPYPAGVRVEEWVNAFHYQLPAPQDEPFSVSAEGAPSPFTRGRTLLKVSLKGREVANADRLPAHLVFLVDTSCSMTGPDRLELAKTSLHTLVRNLNPRDTVAVVTYAGVVREVLEPTPASQTRRIADAISSLSTGGGTNMGSGLEIAYRWASKQVSPDSVSRVIVLTDGDANLGNNQTAEQMRKSIKGYVSEGVTLTTVGFGMGNYRDALLEKLADSGNGQSLYIDSEREARRVFERDISGTLEVIAKDVKVQVAFDPKVVESYRLVGYENRAVADQDFRNDKVDGGEIGAGHSVTALYELDLKHRAAGTIATITVRGFKPHGGPAFETSLPVTQEDFAAQLHLASPDLRFAAAVAGSADLLRGNGHASDFSLARALELARTATVEDVDREEFVHLLTRAIELQTSNAQVSQAWTDNTSQY